MLFIIVWAINIKLIRSKYPFIFATLEKYIFKNSIFLACFCLTNFDVFELFMLIH